MNAAFPRAQAQELIPVITLVADYPLANEGTEGLGIGNSGTGHFTISRTVTNGPTSIGFIISGTAIEVACAEGPRVISSRYWIVLL